MTVANKLFNTFNKINSAKTRCNEALIAQGGTEADTIWEVGDRIRELNCGGQNSGDGSSGNEQDNNFNQDLVDMIEGDIVELDIPDSVTSIADYALYWRTSLTSIVIPDSVASIGAAAFHKCISLSSVAFGENSQLTSIGVNAFYDCYSLTSIVVPNGVTIINSNTFRNCLLESLILTRTSSIVSLGSTYNISNTKIADGTGYIYVPQSLLSEYQSATNWSTYASQFRAIEDYPDIVGG